MLIPIEYLSWKGRLLDRSRYEKAADHAELTERLRKTLYYGKTPTTDRPSLAVTEIAAEFLQDAAPRELGRVDVSIASNVGRRACVSPCSLMLGMIYVERLKHRNPEYLQSVSSSDLFLVSMMMASKYLYDEGVDEEVFNDEWAESAKMDIDELNALERNFVAAIDWNLFVQPEDFWTVLDEVEKRIAKGQGLRRGFYTYSDLEVLGSDGRLYQTFAAVLLEICKVLVVCSVAYVAGTMTLMGSTVTLAYLKHHLPLHHQMALIQPGHTQQHLSLEHATIGQPILAEEDLDLEMTLDSDPDEEEDQNTTAHGHGSITMTTSETHWDPSNRQPPDLGQRRARVQPPDVGQRRLSFGMPGFLTLAIIKDTVVQFVMGANGHVGRTSEASIGTTPDDEMPDLPVGGLSDVSNNEQGTLVCKCGCCNEEKSRNIRCRNITQGNGLYGNGYNGAGRFSWLETQNWLSSGHQGTLCDDQTDCRCCCGHVTGSSPWKHDLSQQLWINQPFHDVTLGFGTSTRALVTG